MWVNCNILKVPVYSKMDHSCLDHQFKLSYFMQYQESAMHFYFGLC